MARKAKAVVASVEASEVTIEEVVEQSTGPSLVSLMAKQVLEAPAEQEVEVTKTEKNVGVGTFIKNLITEGLGNKEILAIVHEQYGNTQTSYACVAWYRNKMKKTSVVVAKNSALDFVTRFAQMSGASEGEVEMVKSELKRVA